MQMHSGKNDVIGLLTALALKLEGQNLLMRSLHSRTPFQKRRKGLLHMGQEESKQLSRGRVKRDELSLTEVVRCVFTDKHTDWLW